MNNDGSKRRIGAMELLGIIGFSLLMGWGFTVFFWFFTYYPADLAVVYRCLVQALLFAGVVCGYLFISMIVGRRKRREWLRPLFVINTILTLPLMGTVLLSDLGIPIHLYGACIASFFAGIALAYFIVRWLDVCSRTRVRNYLTYTSGSFFGGALLFLFCYLMPPIAQLISCVLVLGISIVLLLFIDSRSDVHNGKVAKKRSEFFTFPREIEPPTFVFGIVFGVSFVLLFIEGLTAVFFGLLSLLIGALLMLLVSILYKNIDIVILMRSMLVVSVAACLVVPFSEGPLRAIGLCVLVAAWAAFSVSNYANVVRMVLHHNLSVFYYVSSGLYTRTLGFFIGWLASTLLLLFQADIVILPMFMLGLAFILVLVNMLFYPETQHHLDTTQTECGHGAVTSNTDLDDETLLRRKCEMVAQGFRLTPTETVVLIYLARGRNADYICNKMTVSAHTAKSHIYSIYRKVDIHSQQKLMDFIEESPLDPKNS